MPKLSMRAKLSDPKGLQKKLVGDPMYADGVEALVVKATRQALRSARERAPGSIAGAVSMAIQRKTSGGGFGIIRGVVRVGDRTRKGFRYPWALQASKKVRYRYRSGPRQGKLTRSWFSGARTGLHKLLKAGMSDLSAAIQKSWAS